MKSKLIGAVLLLGLVQPLAAQTADDFVALGRAWLTVTNVAAADAAFSMALAIDPAHETANAFRAATRLLALPDEPADSAFLTRFGVPLAGRNIYDWTARIVTDRNGLPLVPVGADANEFSGMLRTNILSAILASEANLEQITNTGFQLYLNSSETRSSDVMLDYGDIQLLRAWLHAAEYSLYTVCSWNVESRLDLARMLFMNDELSVERVLADHPDLLTFATTNDLNAAKTAFQNGVERYFAASALIRTRPAGVVRLFNLDADQRTDEERFRQTLIDLTNSFAQATALSVATNYSVFLGAQFDAPQAPRVFLPWIRGNAFGLATAPDPTFGGLVYGITPHQVDGFFAKFLFPIPTIAPPFAPTPARFEFPINVAKGHGYAVQYSSNLVQWTDHSVFVADGPAYVFADTNLDGAARRFYRLVDCTEHMPPPANDSFSNRATLSGLGIVTAGYCANASKEPGEPGFPEHSVWFTWTAPVSGLFQVWTTGGGVYATIYTGSSLAGLSFVAYDGNPIFATAGTTYQIQVEGYGQLPLGFQLRISLVPALTVSSPIDGSVLTGPTDILIAASAVDLDGSVGLRFIGDGYELASSSLDSFSFTWSNVPPGYHYIEVQARDNLGAITSSNLFVRVSPPNDNFSNRIPVTADRDLILGSNRGASKEPLEPNHGALAGGRSVWWSWTAPSDGTAVIAARLVENRCEYDLSPIVAVYTGNAVSALTLVASNAPSPAGTARVSFTATAGTEYQIAIDDRYSESGDIYLRVSQGSWNDNFADRFSLAGWVVTTNSSNLGATRELGEPTHAGYDGARSLWWSWTAPSNAAAILSASRTDACDREAGYPVLAVYTGSSISNLVVVASNAATFSGATVQAAFNASAGTTYQIAADDWQEGSGTINLGINTETKLGTPLTLGVPVPHDSRMEMDLLGMPGSQGFFRVTVPPGFSSLEISTGGGWGDCDLYVKYGAPPTLSSWDYCPYQEGNNEIITIPNPAAGDWYILVYGFYFYYGVTLLAH